MVVILGPDGRDLIAEADQFMVEMLFGWLSDREVVAALVADGADPDGVRQMYYNVKRHLEQYEPYERGPLRREVLFCLKSKRARHLIHKATCDGNLEHHEREMEEWAQRVELWLQTPKDRLAGDPPARPADPPTAKEVARNLRVLQKEIEDELAEEEAQRGRLIIT